MKTSLVEKQTTLAMCDCHAMYKYLNNMILNGVRVFSMKQCNKVVNYIKSEFKGMSSATRIENVAHLHVQHIYILNCIFKQYQLNIEAWYYVFLLFYLKKFFSLSKS